jgi:hypothetical protein
MYMFVMFLLNLNFAWQLLSHKFYFHCDPFMAPLKIDLEALVLSVVLTF